MKTVIQAVALTLCVLLSMQTLAHHGSNGQFDSSKPVTVSGVVTKIRFVNPHSYVYFDVVNEEGVVEPWRCELRAGSLLRRTGWTTDMFATGTRLTIDGAAARREPFGCMTQTITFADGRVVQRYDVLEKAAAKRPEMAAKKIEGDSIDLTGNWVAPPRGPRPPRPAANSPVGGKQAGGAPAAGARPAGGPPRGRPRGPRYAQSDAGLELNKTFQRENNPRFKCQATNIFMDWVFDQHVNTVEQSADEIVMSYGFMNIVRTIHLDMTEHPEKRTATRAGHSIGFWDGDELVVDTVGFLPGYLDGTFTGAQHSDAMHVVERFSLSDDGKTLNRNFTINDPLYLSESFEGSDKVMRTNASFEPYECADLTEERVKGF